MSCGFIRGRLVWEWKSWCILVLDLLHLRCCSSLFLALLEVEYVVAFNLRWRNSKECRSNVISYKFLRDNSLFVCGAWGLALCRSSRAAIWAVSSSKHHFLFFLWKELTLINIPLIKALCVLHTTPGSDTEPLFSEKKSVIWSEISGAYCMCRVGVYSCLQAREMCYAVDWCPQL